MGSMSNDEARSPTLTTSFGAPLARAGSPSGRGGHAGKEIQRRQVEHFARADAEYGARVASALEL